MPIYVYQGNKQISTNAIRNNKAVKAIYAKEQGQEAVCVWGDDLVDSLFTYTIQNNSVTITGLKQNNQFSGNLLVPSKIKGKPVTSIGNSAFNGCAGLTSITIPNSVTDIGESVFSDCIGLTNITIPDSVTSIGSSAFHGCSSLESITIPFVGAKAGVTSSDTYQYPLGYIFGESEYSGGIATKQYYYGDSTSSKTSNTYYIPSSLKSVTVTGGNILYGAFYSCTGLTSITIPNGVTNIGSNAFYSCTGLTSITIPNSVTSIGDYAFGYCSGLISITIPDSVTDIGHFAFYNCSELASITIIPNSVTSIGNQAFRGCDKLQNIYITDIAAWCEIPYLYNLMDYGSSNKNLYINNELITTLIIPNGVTVISDSVFRNCSGLTSVTIPNSVKMIRLHTFDGCTGLTSITIPNSVTHIFDYAFHGCTGLMSIVIPDSVTRIGDYSFHNTAWYENQPNGLIYAGKVAYNYKGTMPENTSIVLEEGTLGIASYAFYYCRGLTSVTIPDSVTNIGDYAFCDCSGLTSVTIGNGVKNIGDWVFNYCKNLTSITFNGTIKQWNAIYQSTWYRDYTIHCTDGDIPKRR